MTKKNYFKTEHTNVVKGIAVLMLLSHHLFFGQIATPIHWFGGDSWNQIFATIFKVCVSLFAILSGYGLSQKYKNKDETITDTDFVIKRTSKLLKQYWWVFSIFVPLGFLLGANPISVYGSGIGGLFYCIVDFFGLFPFAHTPTMNYTWWYIEAALAFYLLFPLFFKIVKKHPMIVLGITYVLFVKYAASYCREIFWFFPFCVGIYCSQKDTFNRYMARIERSNEDRRLQIKFSAFIWVFIWLFLRSKIGIAVDVFFSISIIKFVICFIMNKKITKNILFVLGKHSANIFLTHSFIYYYYSVIATPFNTISSNLVKYLVLLVLSFATSVVIEMIKHLLKTYIFNKNETNNAPQPIPQNLKPNNKKMV